jgi:hypothetical protein
MRAPESRFAACPLRTTSRSPSVRWIPLSLPASKQRPCGATPASAFRRRSRRLLPRSCIGDAKAIHGRTSAPSTARQPERRPNQRPLVRGPATCHIGNYGVQLRVIWETIVSGNRRRRLLPLGLLSNVPHSFEWCSELFGRPVCGDQVQESSRQTWSASAPIGVVEQQPSPREVSRPSLIESAAMSATTVSEGCCWRYLPGRQYRGGRWPRRRARPRRSASPSTPPSLR